MSEIQPFEVEGSQWRFGQDEDGRPWVVAADVARSFDYRDAERATRLLDEEEKGTRIAGTPGGDQRVAVLFEDGVWELIFRSSKPEAKRIKKRVKVILREIRQTGSFAVDRLPVPRDYPAALRYAADQYEARVRAEQRAAELEPAAQNWEAVQAGDGIALRTFHKKYFSDVPERQFFQHLYAHGYLIDQRGKGAWSERRQRNRDGAQHRHPSFKGKPYLYLHATVDNQGVRRESVRVRSGQRELEFRTLLIREGLPPNQTDNDIERSAA